jgi:RNA polymerase sigma-70 factor (sigma-E family)
MPAGNGEAEVEFAEPAERTIRRHSPQRAASEARDAGDFDRWARAKLPALVGFAVLLTGDRGLAEDVVQEVMLRSYGRWSRIVELDHPEAYVRRMIVNEVLSWRRRLSSRTFPEPDAGADLSVGDHSDAQADRVALWSELARLPRRQRVVLVLRYYEHLTDTEIAEVLACPHGTVRSLASRALATLRIDDRIQQLLGDR